MEKNKMWLVVLGLIVIGGISFAFFAQRRLLLESIDQYALTTEKLSQSIQSERAKRALDTPISEAHRVAYSDTRKMLYMNKENQLMLYDLVSKEKKVLLKDTRITDYDLSHDGNTVVYTRRQNYDALNADIFLLDTKSLQVEQITDTSDIAEINPIFFPDDKKIAFVKRLRMKDSDDLTDGEIWTLDTHVGVGEQKLIGNNRKKFINPSDLQKTYDENGKWDGAYMCIGLDEIVAPKIGIDSISADGRNISYWQASWAPECSGLWHDNEFSEIDGREFFTKDFLRSNGTMRQLLDRDEWFSWRVWEIFWFPGGGFVTNNFLYPPLGGNAVLVYGKNQKKVATIFDNSGPNHPSASLVDIKPIDNHTALIAWLVPLDGVYVQKISIDRDMTFEDFTSGKRLLPTDANDNFASSWKLIDENTLVYEKYLERRTLLYVFDAGLQKAIEVDSLN